MPHRNQAAASRQRQLLGAQQLAGLDLEELHLTTDVQAHRDLILLLHRQHQRRLRLGQPRGALRRTDFQVGTLEHGCDHLGQIEEDQRDGHQYGEPADGDKPAGQAILEPANAPLASQGGGIEVQTERRLLGAQSVLCQIVHARNLCAY
jgi:hypothetical protein